ncbi:MAG: hypothetical protein M3457_00030 [Chloroflexota bacterium]|nr:hypothetical protein [Chloroflexota bacterium]
MIQLAVLADDLTGGADTGAAFASVGLVTSIAFGGHAPDCDVLVVSTNSREIDLATAADRNLRAATALATGPATRRPRWVYKKIDSALRGHPREELLAVMAGLGESRALIAPALPSEARTTVNGRQFLDGRPLEATSLGSSQGPSDLVSLFGSGGEVSVHALGFNTIRNGPEEIERVLRQWGSGLVIADAETELDLLLIARAALRSDLRLLAGSAGLAGQLARVLAPASVSHKEVAGRPASPALVVAGSLHESTASQVGVLQAAGLPIVRPVDALLHGSSRAKRRAVDELAMHLAAGRSVVLATAGLPPSRYGSAFVVSCLADIVAAPGVRRHMGGLVLTGGETAAGILAGLGAIELRLMGEIRPAMPWGVLRTRDLPVMPIATKAGSFGEDDALLTCVEHLTRTGLR